jgi:hypothetical protein
VTSAAALLLFAAGALREPAHQGATVLQVLAPLDAGEVVVLDRCFAEHAAEWGVVAHVLRIVSPGVRDLAPDTLLFCYERSLLEELAAERLLHGGADGVRSTAGEAWQPAWRPDSDGRAPAVTTFFGLIEADQRGVVVSRRLTETSSDGLVLGAIAATLGWTDDLELRELALGDSAEGALRSDSASTMQLLRDLAPGAAMVAPRRVVVAAQAEGLPLGSAPFLDGTPRLELASALSSGSGAAVVRWFVDRFERDVAPILAGALHLEPCPGPADGGGMLEFNLAAAKAARARLVELQAAQGVETPADAVSLALRFIDEVLITGAVIAVWVVALRFGRRRDPRGGGVV